MADRYLHWTNTRPGRTLSRRLGLPRPVPLHRWSAERPSLEGGLLHLTPVPSREGAAQAKELAGVLDGVGLDVHGEAGPGTRYAAAVVDATGVRTVAELRAVHAALHPVVRSLASCGRVVVLGSRPDPDDHRQAAAQQALEGFVRSLGKELGGGRTAQLLRLAPGAGAAHAESTLRFLLSPRSAYVSGQVVEIGESAAPDGQLTQVTDWDRPLSGRTALVTGSARGIGESVAATLARDGAHVICLDVPQAEEALHQVAEAVGGTALPLDITADDAGERIARALPADGLDVLVHNAGITRDRRLANMSAERWASVLEVNLESVYARPITCWPRRPCAPAPAASSPPRPSRASPGTRARPTTPPARPGSSAWSARSPRARRPSTVSRSTRSPPASSRRR